MCQIINRVAAGRICAHMRRIFMRQLSRLDKIGNSRFEYTKMFIYSACSVKSIRILHIYTPRRALTKK